MFVILVRILSVMDFFGGGEQAELGPSGLGWRLASKAEHESSLSFYIKSINNMGNLVDM